MFLINNVFVASNILLFENFQVIQMEQASCAMETTVVFDTIVCQITVTKYGNPVFSYTGIIDFGDGFINNFTITNWNQSVIMISHSYLKSGSFSVQLLIPSLNISKTLQNSTFIYGELIIMKKSIFFC
jgi:hypothetical protein